MSSLKIRLRKNRKIIIAALVTVVAVVATFFAGAASNDESATVSDLEETIAEVRLQLSDTEAEVVDLEAGREAAEEEADTAREELAVERDFQGVGPSSRPPENMKRITRRGLLARLARISSSQLMSRTVGKANGYSRLRRRTAALRR
jgi:phage shock protein A